MRILADANVSPRTVSFLRGLGHDAVRSTDRLPAEAADAAVLALARAEGRAVLTHDLDYSVLLAASGERAPSVLLLRLRVADPDSVNRRLALVLPGVERSVEAGAVVIIEEHRYRVRALPVGATGSPRI